jgi:hypothetical protein
MGRIRLDEISRTNRQKNSVGETRFLFLYPCMDIAGVMFNAAAT